MNRETTIVVPYDFSNHADVALSTAISFARGFGARMHLVHVVAPPTSAFVHGAYPGAEAARTARLRETVEEAAVSLRRVARATGASSSVLDTHVVEGIEVAEQIRCFAVELDVDLLVMGAHGQSGLTHLPLGSIARQTLRIAPCPVLTVQLPNLPVIPSATARTPPSF